MTAHPPTLASLQPAVNQTRGVSPRHKLHPPLRDQSQLSLRQRVSLKLWDRLSLDQKERSQLGRQGPMARPSLLSPARQQVLHQSREMSSPPPIKHQLSAHSLPQLGKVLPPSLSTPALSPDISSSSPSSSNVSSSAVSRGVLLLQPVVTLLPLPLQMQARLLHSTRTVLVRMQVRHQPFASCVLSIWAVNECWSNMACWCLGSIP